MKPASAEEITAGTSGIPTGRATGINVTLKRCIIGAYHIGLVQVLGGPSWIDADRFHIEAKAATPVDDDTVIDAMLRSLLAERFHLVLHRETRAIRALVLGIAKGGPMLEKGVGTRRSDGRGAWAHQVVEFDDGRVGGKAIARDGVAGFESDGDRGRLQHEA